jgi:catechol 2,3-dioxygenase-like lactoylglutathione lyase family enzyme
MTEIQVGDWPGAVRWYVDVLGLRLVFDDPGSRFALLAAGPARIALKGGDPQEGLGVRNVRLVFRVADVDAAYARLQALGVAATAPADHPREPYRETRLCDPEGTPITVFAWRGEAEGVGP